MNVHISLVVSQTDVHGDAVVETVDDVDHFVGREVASGDSAELRVCFKIELDCILET